MENTPSDLHTLKKPSPYRVNGEENTQETVNNIEAVVCSKKVLNEEEIRNLTQLYELVRSGKAKDADILESAESKEIREKFERFKE